MQNRLNRIKLMSALIMSAMTWPVVAQDNCWMRSTTQTNSVSRITNVATVRQILVDLPNGLKQCQVVVRAQAGSEWVNLEATYDWFPANASDQSGCEMAKNLAVHRWNTKQNSQVQSTQVMTCSDEPGLSLKPVSEGDIITEGEVKIHPNKPNYFSYKGSRCRWFIETDIKKNDVYQWQGIICEMRPSVWQVVSKF